MVGRGGKGEKKEEQVRSGRVIEKEVKEGGGKGKGEEERQRLDFTPFQKFLNVQKLQSKLVTVNESVYCKRIIRFLPSDAMHKRGICRHAVSVRLSVCPSVTFVDHVKMNKHIFEIFLPSDSQAILVFPYQTGWRYSDGNPPNGGVDCKGGMKK